MASARERPQAIRLTEEAAERVKALIARSEKPIIGLRIGVKNTGCAGMSYTMEYAEDIKPSDEVVEDRGVKVLIDPRAVLFLIGTEMDWNEDKFQSGFTFRNPNEVERCGCGESFRVA